MRGIVEINAGIKLRRDDFLAALDQHTGQHEQQAQNQEGGRNHVRQNADIGAGPNRDGVNNDEKKNVGHTDDGQSHARKADPVAHQHAQTVPGLNLRRRSILSVHA